MSKRTLRKGGGGGGKVPITADAPIKYPFRQFAREKRGCKESKTEKKEEEESFCGAKARRGGG